MRVSNFLFVILSVFSTAVSANSDFISTNAPACAPYAGLIDNKDGTLTDERSDLIWSRCDYGAKFVKGKGCVGEVKTWSWSEGLAIAKKSRASGADNWRMPTLDEFASIAGAWDNCFTNGYRSDLFAAVDTRLKMQDNLRNKNHPIHLLGLVSESRGQSFYSATASLLVGYRNPPTAADVGLINLSFNSKELGANAYLRLVRNAKGRDADSNLNKFEALYLEYVVNRGAALDQRTRAAAQAEADAVNREAERKRKKNASYD